jgi:transcriptional regulator with GAF, ATPase, and Fis domain
LPETTRLEDPQSQVSFANFVLGDLTAKDTLEEWLEGPLVWLIRNAGVEYTSVLERPAKDWLKKAERGRLTGSIPWHAVAEAMEHRSPAHVENWWLYPLQSPNAHEWCWLVQRSARNNGPTSRWNEELFAEFGAILSSGLNTWTSFQVQQRDLHRITQILNVAADWHRHLDLNKLLESIAMTATRLLNCDRASIFLWDKPAKELVGHPALGIEGKPLRIPDGAGLAGAVLKSMEPRRWDRSSPADEVNRQVDNSLGYRTDSLLAVPLIDVRGKGMGVFEVINHRAGRFGADDQRDLIELARHASAALTRTQQVSQLVETRDRLIQDAINQVQLIGASPQMENLRATINRVGDTDLAVLLLGENGTGKEVVSRQIHYRSKRRHEPFIAVNCAAITETLLESELFGHEKGAFTDAHDTRVGKFELANGGTLFLDEIGDMSLSGQAKLLRVLEEKVVVRVGGSSPIPVNVRVIAATNQNLVELVQAKRFREDLYFRLTVVTMNLPPLRERRDDVVVLADFFMGTFCQKIGRPKPEWSAAAKRRLQAHDWPGNVRELRNIVERLAYLTSEETIDESQVDFVRSPRSDARKQEGMDLSLSLADATDVFQTRFIEEHIRAAGRNITLAAEKLGLQRSNLYRKMKQLGMKPPD